jgi:hypothetical protein
MLIGVFNMPHAAGMDDDAVEYQFTRILNRVVVDLEKDIGSFS